MSGADPWERYAATAERERLEEDWRRFDAAQIAERERLDARAGNVRTTEIYKTATKAANSPQEVTNNAKRR